MTSNKNNGIQAAGRGRERLLLLALLAPLAGAFVSRGALSAGCLLFAAVALAQGGLRSTLRRFATTPLLWGLSLLFFLPLLSGLWSQDFQQWANVVRIKLPLLFFPLAVAGSWQLSQKRWMMVAAVFLLLVFGGCCWGLLAYAQNATEMQDAYLRAKTLPTPLENDHVRFGWLVAVAVVLCLLLRQTAAPRAGWSLVLLALFFVVYLHVLSARTGLLCLYLFLALYAAWLVVRQANRRLSIAVALVLLLLPCLAYLLLPTFRARLQYNRYDLSFVRQQAYLPGSSDGARSLSLKAGWQVLRQHPFGAGAGDVMTEADKWYAVHVPQVLPTDKFYPSSEWLLYGAFAGWPGVLLFTGVMALPFFVRGVRHRVFWCALQATAAASFLFDMGLEVQYGVFFYSFLLCWWWKWLCAPEQPLSR